MKTRYIVMHKFTGHYLSHIDEWGVPIWNSGKHKAKVDTLPNLVAIVGSCDRMSFDFCEIVEASV